MCEEKIESHKELTDEQKSYAQIAEVLERAKVEIIELLKKKPPPPPPEPEK